jgi:DNA-binding transcriptional MerR regulator
LTVRFFFRIITLHYHHLDKEGVSVGKLLKIGELAKYSNVSKRTIDYYTKMGLLQVEQVSQTGYRFYSEKCIEQLTLIHYYKKQHLQLEEIKERLLQLQDICSKETTMKLEQIQHKIDEIQLELQEAKTILGEKEKEYLRQTILVLLSYL